VFSPLLLISQVALVLSLVPYNLPSTFIVLFVVQLVRHDEVNSQELVGTVTQGAMEHSVTTISRRWITYKLEALSNIKIQITRLIHTNALKPDGFQSCPN
jgi:hypothetical protein